MVFFASFSLNCVSPEMETQIFCWKIFVVASQGRPKIFSAVPVDLGKETPWEAWIHLRGNPR